MCMYIKCIYIYSILVHYLKENMLICRTMYMIWLFPFSPARFWDAHQRKIKTGQCHSDYRDSFEQALEFSLWDAIPGGENSWFRVVLSLWHHRRSPTTQVVGMSRICWIDIWMVHSKVYMTYEWIDMNRPYKTTSQNNESMSVQAVHPNGFNRSYNRTHIHSTYPRHPLTEWTNPCTIPGVFHQVIISLSIICFQE